MKARQAILAPALTGILLLSIQARAGAPSETPPPPPPPQLIGVDDRSWIAQPPDDSKLFATLEAAPKLEKSRIVTVPPETRMTAIALLRDTSIQPLDAATLRQLLPNATDAAKMSSAGLTPYLARSVAAGCGRGEYDIRQAGEALSIFTGTLGPSAFARCPVIVFLEHPATRVWVEAAAAL
ncbi:hypothetical protein [Nitrospirillum sp. BR 11828]|uniref:hypothetical protein n=1 Tax=Nitrospirillum sp. BR 11828 TaxID=3104325 RepID=UPI002ACA3860|nr:hypothetical protein [Nitrospirillum sp. BR 11828]MDZ5647082.1 hypothetical protein [Nitrospirillum sp. BR 11828]